MRGIVVDGDAVLGLRKQRGWTQEQLAELAGLDVKTIRKAEQGRRLDLKTLTKLVFALQTELRRLIRPSRSAQEREIRQRDLVLLWQRYFEKHDLEGLRAMYHEDAVLHLPGGPLIPSGGMFCGKSEIGGAHHVAWNICPVEPTTPAGFSLFVSDDLALLEGIMAIQLPDGSTARLACTQVFRFKADFVIYHRVEYDTLNFARLLQLLPPATKQTMNKFPVTFLGS